MEAKSIMNMLMDYDTHRCNFNTPLKDIHCYENATSGHLGIDIGDNPYSITRWAVGQLSNDLDIPARYIHKCPPYLAATNLNYWIEKSKRRELKICTRTTSNDTLVIGIVTPRFIEYQNVEFLEDCITAMGSNRYVFGSMTLNDVCMDLPISLLDYMDDQDMGVGLHMRNSEVGYASASLSTILYGTGVYIPVDSFLKESYAKMIHLRKDHEGFKKDIIELINNIEDHWHEIINIYKRSQDHAITVREVRSLINEFRLPKGIMDNRLGIDIFSKTTDEDRTVVLKDIIDALNEEAGKLKYPRKWDIQKIGGVVLGRLSEALLWD